MRILRVLLQGLFFVLLLISHPKTAIAADRPANVLLQYQFVGASRLAQNQSAELPKKIFSMPATGYFENIALNHLCLVLAKSIHFPANTQPVPLLRPMIDDLLLSESMVSMGAGQGSDLDFVLAVKLDAARAQLWQKNFRTAFQTGGQPFRDGNGTGTKWSVGGSSFWIVPAGNWLLVGKGEGMAQLRSSYLQQIAATGRPAPNLDFKCFEADVDWPRLASYIDLSDCPLKLGRTQFNIRPEKGIFILNGRVDYPQPIAWQTRTRHLPDSLVHEPLFSFTTGVNVAPFLKSDETVSHFPTDPWRDQFYFWSMGEMALQTYAAWPAQDPTNVMRQLYGPMLNAFNPILQQLNHSILSWQPQAVQITWKNLQLATPQINAAPASAGPFIIAGLFPLTPGKGNVPPTLWTQLADPNLIYYDWEFTGPRLRQLLTASQLLPLLQLFGIGSHPFAPVKDILPPSDTRIKVDEGWLLSLTPLLGNTVTQVTKAGPNSVKITRNSPFIFNSIELLLLAHWLTDSPAGPLDWNLLPQAKMTRSASPPH